MIEKDKLKKIIANSQYCIESKPRDYIGASIIGSDCLRQIWYEFKGETGAIAENIIRTFEIGKNLEALVIDWLIRAGLNIVCSNDSYVSCDNPLFKGTADAVLVTNDECYIIEIKTAKNSSFNTFVKKGLQLWNSQYYAQIQSYMGMSGLHKAYILVLNKDNSELSDELVLFDARYYQILEEKAHIIARAVCPPPRVSNSPLWFQCKTCKFNKICHI